MLLNTNHNTELTVGADIEFFIKKGSEIVSAIDILQKGNLDPLVIDNYHLHYDNVLAEISNITPSTSSNDFYHNITMGMAILEDVLRKKRCSLHISSSELVPYSILNCMEALEFGCDEDMDMWLNAYMAPPDPFLARNLRSAAGHIHVGIPNNNPEDTLLTARASDIYMGLVSVVLDNDKRRKTLYGKSSRCRIKDYGFEYRTPSNFWTTNKYFIKGMYHMAYLSYSNRKIVQNLGEQTINKIKHVIDTSNVRGAKILLSSLVDIDYINDAFHLDILKHSRASFNKDKPKKEIKKKVLRSAVSFFDLP